MSSELPVFRGLRKGGFYKLGRIRLRRLWSHSELALRLAGLWALFGTSLFLVDTFMRLGGSQLIHGAIPLPAVAHEIQTAAVLTAIVPLFWLFHLRRARRMAEASAPARARGARTLPTRKVIAWAIRNGDDAIRIAYATAGLSVLAAAGIAISLWTSTGEMAVTLSGDAILNAIAASLSGSAFLIVSGHMGKIRFRRPIPLAGRKIELAQFLLILTALMLLSALIVPPLISPAAGPALRGLCTFLLFGVFFMCFGLSLDWRFEKRLRREHLLALAEGRYGARSSNHSWEA